MSQCRVEVVASTVEDVLAAAQGGADRVEFCVHLDSGGLTPGRSLSRAAFDVAKEHGLVFRVLVRPREGDFVYTKSEQTATVREAEALMEMGVDKVVTGGLQVDGMPDVALVQALDKAIGLDHVVFHRAIDEVSPLMEGAQRLLDLGVRTVLSSGGMSRAVEGKEAIAQLVQVGLEVVAGAGVQPAHVADLAGAGVEAVHASCRVLSPGHMAGRLFAAERKVVDAGLVLALVSAVRGV